MRLVTVRLEGFRVLYSERFLWLFFRFLWGLLSFYFLLTLLNVCKIKLLGVVLLFLLGGCWLGENLYKIC